MKVEFSWRDYDDYAKWLQDVLTTLYEENEQLKVEKVKLLSENQQLKKQKDELETSYDILQKNNTTLAKQKEEAYKIADDYYKENQQLKKNKDKAIEYIEKHPCNTWYSVIKPNKDLREVKVIKHQEKLKNILKGDSDE